MTAQQTRPGGRHCLNERGGLIMTGETNQQAPGATSDDPVSDRPATAQKFDLKQAIRESLLEMHGTAPTAAEVASAVDRYSAVCDAAMDRAYNRPAMLTRHLDVEYLIRRCGEIPE